MQCRQLRAKNAAHLSWTAGPPRSYASLWDVCNPSVPPIRFTFWQVLEWKLDSKQGGNPLKNIMDRMGVSEDHPQVVVVLVRVSGGGLQVRVVQGMDCVAIVRNHVGYPTAMLGGGIELAGGDYLKLYLRASNDLAFSGPLGLEYFVAEDDFRVSLKDFLMPGQLQLEDKGVDPKEELIKLSEDTKPELVKCKNAPKPMPVMFVDLPNEIITRILSELSPSDVLRNVAPTCQWLNKIVWGGIPFRSISLPRVTSFTQQEIEAIQNIGQICPPSAITINGLQIAGELGQLTEQSRNMMGIVQGAQYLRLLFSSTRVANASPEQHQLAMNMVKDELREMGVPPELLNWAAHLQLAVPDFFRFHRRLLERGVFDTLRGQQSRLRFREVIRAGFGALNPKAVLQRILPAGAFAQFRVIQIEGDITFPVQDCTLPNLKEAWITAPWVNLAAFLGEQGNGTFPQLKSFGYSSSGQARPALPVNAPAAGLERVHVGSLRHFPFYLVKEAIQTLMIDRICAGTLRIFQHEVPQLKQLQKLAITALEPNSESLGPFPFHTVPPSVEVLIIKIFGLTDEELGMVCTQLPKLEYFHAELISCEITGDGVAAMVEHCPSLKKFSIKEVSSGDEVIIRNDLIPDEYRCEEYIWNKRIRFIFGPLATTSDLVPPAEESYRPFSLDEIREL